MIFFIYQFFISIILLFSPVIIIYRILKNKEDKFRVKEKFCFPSEKRSRGKLVWFHGSSVGEIMSIIPIIKKYDKDRTINRQPEDSLLIFATFLVGHNYFPAEPFALACYNYSP